ncbi:MAG: CvpA family protein [Lachnospirales bacterium]
MENASLIADGIVIAILLISIIVGAYRGLIKTVFKTFSSIIALALAYFLHPILTRLVNKTPVFDFLKLSFADKLGLSLTTENVTQAEQTNLISSLPLPDFINDMLIENNNTVVHELLDTHGIADYICGYLANLVISIAVTLILVLFMGLIVRAIIKSLDIMAKLPVISQLNFLGGGIIGTVSGVIIIWLIFLFAMLFVTDASFALIQEAIDGSVVCKLLYDNNLLRSLIMGDLF